MQLPREYGDGAIGQARDPTSVQRFCGERQPRVSLELAQRLKRRSLSHQIAEGSQRVKRLCDCGPGRRSVPPVLERVPDEEPCQCSTADISRCLLCQQRELQDRVRLDVLAVQQQHDSRSLLRRGLASGVPELVI